MSELYKVAVKVSAVPKAQWTSICRDRSGAIDSLVELLQGRFSKGVMERICQQKTGLFPAPAEIEFSCSCPDWASMCKQVAALLYGIGARLDERPEFLFRPIDTREKRKRLISPRLWTAAEHLHQSSKARAPIAPIAVNPLVSIQGWSCDRAASTES